MRKSTAKRRRPLLPHRISHLTHLWQQARSLPCWNGKSWIRISVLEVWQRFNERAGSVSTMAPHREWKTENAMRHLECLVKILRKTIPIVFLWAKWGTDSALGWGQQMPESIPRMAGYSGNICHCPLWVLRGGNQTSSALCRLTHSQICKPLLCFCTSDPPSCVYGDIFMVKMPYYRCTAS